MGTFLRSDSTSPCLFKALCMLLAVSFRIPDEVRNINCQQTNNLILIIIVVKDKMLSMSLMTSQQNL